MGQSDLEKLTIGYNRFLKHGKQMSRRSLIGPRGEAAAKRRVGSLATAWGQAWLAGGQGGEGGIGAD